MNFNATFLISAISFIIFVFIMNQILYKPVAKIVEQRQKYLRDNEDNANFSNNQAQELILDKNEKTKLANEEAGEIILNGSNSAKEEKSRLLNQALTECKEQVEANRQHLQQEKSDLKQSMAQDTQSITNAILEKFIGKEQV